MVDRRLCLSWFLESDMVSLVSIYHFLVFSLSLSLSLTHTSVLLFSFPRKHVYPPSPPLTPSELAVTHTDHHYHIDVVVDD